MSREGTESGETGRWYDLFSRGARDWLRHNDKLREQVREHLPELVTGPDLITRPGDRTVQVPVRFLEHYRFRFAQNPGKGVGQGKVNPGDVLRPGKAPEGDGQGEGSGSRGGSGSGELNFVFEFRVDDIVDWIWEELELPDLEPRISGKIQEEEIVREGWGKRGPRARLDRRRTLKEAIKRRGAQPDDAAAIVDDDLRFHQLARRQRPSTDAVVLFILDVSASMTEPRRRLAKSFFFWSLQGLRRRYGVVEPVFIAHTNEAWEFSEAEFFKVAATGGTVASSGFRLAQDILAARYAPTQYNAYLFYASDGDNFGDDQGAAADCLQRLSESVTFMGFVETPQNFLENGRSEMGRLFQALEARDFAVACHTVHEHGDVWEAIRDFFSRDAAAGRA